VERFLFVYGILPWGRADIFSEQIGGAQRNYDRGEHRDEQRGEERATEKKMARA
jgi:hypothetical protein